MSKARTIARRTFLVGSVAIAGGVAFGYYAYRRPFDNPLLVDLPSGSTAITPYLRIDKDGVTIITPRGEMGQGVHTALAALVAEELDLAWDDIRVEHGPASAAYYNGAVMGEGLPFMSTDQGFLARNARALGDVAGKFMGVQITGGSSSVPDGFVKMRRAGAAAREVFLKAASKESGVALEQLKTGDSAVILPDGSRLSYVSLAPTAAHIDVPDEPKLKPQQDWRFLGKPMQRIDVADKVNGQAEYAIDIRLPGMVYATVKTNPRIGGGLVGYDASAAEAMRGVLSVVPITGGVGIIADNTWRAFKAADAISYNWGPAPYASTTEEMFDAVAKSFVDDLQDSQFRDDGDVEDALLGANVIEAEYKVPFLAHAPMEPMNAVVLLGDGKLDIWVGTQIPTFVVAAAAEMTGLNDEDIHVHTLLMGGSFGRRLEDDYVRQAIELAQAMPGTPVKMTWSREEDMSHDFCRPLGMARMRGAVKDGAVDTYDLDICSPSVSASQMGRLGLSVPGPDTMIVAGAWDQPFAIPNYRVTGYRAPEQAPVSSWRSVGASINGFFHDAFLDELIHAAGADPMHERIRLASHEPSRRVLEAVAEMSDWDSPPGDGRARGVAFCLSFGVPCAQVVEVSKTKRGIRVEKVFAAVDVGTVLDPINVESQVTGGIIWGLSHAMFGEITYNDGAIEQSNFHDYLTLRMKRTPVIEVRALENAEQIRGIGEPGVPPAAPALANAIFAATGKRIRELPMAKHVSFV